MPIGSGWGQEAAYVGGSIGQLIAGIEGGQNTNNALQSGINNAQGALTSSYSTAAGYQQPYDSAGATGLSGQQNIANMAPAQSNFQYNYQQDPAYQNQLTAGNGDIMSQAASSGNLFSGATMKAINQYGSSLANQSYNQNYNRAFTTYTNQRDFNESALLNKYNQYAMLSNVGQNAANNLSGLQTQLGQGQANLDIQSGNANAGQQAQTYNTIGNFVTNLTSQGMGSANQTSGSMGGLNSIGSGGYNGGSGITMQNSGGGLNMGNYGSVGSDSAGDQSGALYGGQGGSYDLGGETGSLA